MKKMLLMMCAVLMLQELLISNVSYAASQDECAIWLCLPGGFPEGCGSAHRAYLKRLRKGKSPLPNFSSCSVNSDSTGRYQIGYELWQECSAGTTSIEYFDYNQNRQVRGCINSKCLQNNQDIIRQIKEGLYLENNAICPITYAQERVQPNYIQMWVDNKYLGKFFY